MNHKKHKQSKSEFGDEAGAKLHNTVILIAVVAIGFVAYFSFGQRPQPATSGIAPLPSPPSGVPSPSSPTTSSPSASSTPQSGGGTLGRIAYETYCSSCHGPSGEGARGPALKGRALDVSRIKTVVPQGTGQMPSFAQIDAVQLNALANYVNGLK